MHCAFEPFCLPSCLQTIVSIRYSPYEPSGLLLQLLSFFDMVCIQDCSWYLTKRIIIMVKWRLHFHLPTISFSHLILLNTQICSTLSRIEGIRKKTSNISIKYCTNMELFPIKYFMSFLHPVLTPDVSDNLSSQLQQSHFY